MARFEAPVAEKPSASRAHRVYFTFAISWIARFLTFRDRVFGWDKSGRTPEGIHERSSRHSIVSAASILDAVFVEPVSRPAIAAVLLCHGIGETVEQWFGVQQILAANGVTSLAFDYSGYGKSAGRPDWDQFELDAIASFDTLRQLAPHLPLSVLGFSLGSGVAVATINKVSADRLVLCEAFTSFRGAAHSFWIPKALSFLVPPIWHAQEQLSNCKLPVLIVHGERDRLFPVETATDLAAYCSSKAEVVLVPDTAHNQPFRKPHLSYWGPIVEWLGT
jgi:alpha-beta hydrolase superfamily lysophospholipase